MGNSDTVVRMTEDKDTLLGSYASHHVSLALYDSNGDVAVASVYADVGTDCLSDMTRIEEVLNQIDKEMGCVAQLKAELINFEMSVYETKRILVEAHNKLAAAAKVGTSMTTSDPDEVE